MEAFDDVVRVEPLSDGGVELHAITGGEGFVLRLDDAAGLSLCDDLARACERKLRPVAA